jgi:hypothetical protein
VSTLRIEHELGRDGARERIAGLAKKHSVQLETADGLQGHLSKTLPFVGRVRARFAIEERLLEVEILEAPAFPSAETLRRMVEDELKRALTR